MEKLLKLSVSKSKTFEQCKKKYNYTYNLKMPRKEFSFHTFGKFAHKALEDFHLAYINGSTKPFNEEMQIAYKAAKKEFASSLTPELIKECFDLLNRYLKIYTNQVKTEDFSVLSVEKSFNLQITDNMLINGMIDRIQIDSDGVLHVADYKTTKDKKYLKDDWFQLATYGLVLLSEDPSITKIRGSYVMLRHDFEYITKEFNVDEMLMVKQKYIDYANKINEEKLFQPSITPLCNFCDFADICEDYQAKIRKEQIFGEVKW